jgi:hypothetical protein
LRNIQAWLLRRGREMSGDYITRRRRNITVP